MRYGRRIGTIVCAATLAASFAALAQTNVYRWVDKDGKVHFSDSPPPKEVKESSSKMMGGGSVATGQMPYETQQAMKKNPVTLYTSSDCGDLCAQVQQRLRRPVRAGPCIAGQAWRAVHRAQCFGQHRRCRAGEEAHRHARGARAARG